MGDIRIPIWLISIPVLAYGLAWVFFDRFFWTFGIELRTISIPPEHYFAWGTNIFMWVLFPDDLSPIKFLPHLFGLLALASLLIPQDKFGLLRRVSLSVTLALFVMLLFGQAARLGEREALSRAAPSFQVDLVFSPEGAPTAALPTIPVQMQAPPEQMAAPDARINPAAELSQAHVEHALRLIWQDHDATVVGVPRDCVADAEGNPACNWTIFRVQTQQISVSRSVVVGERSEVAGP